MAQVRRGVRGWSALAAATLLVLGVVFAAGGVWLLITGFGHGPGSGGLFEVMSASGLALLVVGGVHGAASTLIAMDRPSGASLGLVVGVVGTLIAMIGVVVSIGSALDPPPGNPGGDFVGLGLPLPYLLVLVALYMDRRTINS